MAAHGYIPLLRQYLDMLERPRVLEIGVEHGIMTVPLLAHLRYTKPSFKYDCVDIQRSQPLTIMLQYMSFVPEQVVMFHTINSLQYLRECDGIYDLVLLDGDHNYYTVSQELEMLVPRLARSALIVADDYDGRWSENDMFYAERETHLTDDVQARATQPVDTEKHGVKAAIDEFLVAHRDGFVTSQPLAGEPIMILTGELNERIKSMSQQTPPAEGHGDG